MRIRFHTQSGSMYVVDSDKMAWERVSDHGIIGYGNDKGILKVFSPVTVGMRYQFITTDPSYDDDETPILTTTVTKAEII